MQATGKVGLFGAAGAAGQSIATALGAAGRDYRVVGRSRDVLQRTFGDDPHAEIVTWNPDDPASIRAAAAGLQTVIYLVGVPYDQFAQHPPLMEKTLAGVTAAGVERFILIGTVYPYGRARGNPVREDHPREPHTFKGRMLRVLGLFNPLMRELVEMNYLMTEPVVLDDSALATLIGTLRKTPYQEGIRRCFEAAREVMPARDVN